MNQYFNLNGYYSNLKTKRLGRPCIYLEQVDSTIDVACEQNPDTIVLAKEQLKGRGQRSNVWQSPFGCAMGSLRVSSRKISYLSKRLCFLQHILALSAAKTLERIDGKKLGKNFIRLKWPNDIVYKPPDRKVGLKIGGVLVNTKDLSDEYDITLSFGINVFNKEPTTCISEIIGNDKNITIDSVVADIMNHLEDYILDLNDERFEELKADYTARCLHINKLVEDEDQGPIRVKEVNDDGYLVGERCTDKKLCIVTKISSFDW